MPPRPQAGALPPGPSTARPPGPLWTRRAAASPRCPCQARVHSGPHRGALPTPPPRPSLPLRQHRAQGCGLRPGAAWGDSAPHRLRAARAGGLAVLLAAGIREAVTGSGRGPGGRRGWRAVIGLRCTASFPPGGIFYVGKSWAGLVRPCRGSGGPELGSKKGRGQEGRGGHEVGHRAGRRGLQELRERTGGSQAGGGGALQPRGPRPSPGAVREWLKSKLG